MTRWIKFWGITPLEIRSAGLSSVGMYPHRYLLVSCWIFLTLLAMNNSRSSGFFAIQLSTTCESHQKFTESKQTSTTFTSLSTSSARSSAPSSSPFGVLISFGTFLTFFGRSLDLLQINRIVILPSG
uniref:(northern house mosquito) hypothetical protein n=1 Tax=Culex pipiens TaxID=7175 RepID=A0A8D8GBG0_CULPI